MSKCMSIDFIHLTHVCLVNRFSISARGVDGNVAIGLVVEVVLDGV